MIPVRKLETAIPDLTGMAVLIIAGCAFALSFFNLQDAALEAGIKPWLSWLWPVCIDALLIAGSLMILRSSLRNESPLIGWIVLLSFTGVSTLFNVLHSPADIVSQAAHAVPPVALCVSIELLMMTIRSDLMVGEHVCTCTSDHACAHVLSSHEQLHEHMSRSDDHIDCQPEQTAGKLPEHSDMPTEQVLSSSEQSPEHLSRSDDHIDKSVQIRLYFTDHPGCSVAQAARELNMSRHTVKKHKPVEPVQEICTYGNEMFNLSPS
ncbi:DUF2637 domain-containing protein [Methanospirillum sp. J.3.6.1-F.2.7.3]|uniref:DUF2637 domain-containing protein n=1 Tax=Methanospirillum purgamenti TaxID=2834276 RepID=A0A8E7B243_9EURY|nr:MULTISPECIES: DUF2637 domain-containing protein [Methanospirillum]MDX8549645.1 DUF2637 domain-containing protein [Methanospirillum hungatei]QVV89027.1 DUF2637 domain-containing protein [Methanospirillum sp. J.3.6.1-F.2.7.3]